VACRLLGSLSEAEDAVQEAWLRFNRIDPRDSAINCGAHVEAPLSSRALPASAAGASMRTTPEANPGTHLHLRTPKSRWSRLSETLLAFAS
jgi:hypothetical protein